MSNGKSPTDVMGAVEERVRAFAPTSVAFMLTVTGGIVSRCRRLQKENDRGAVSIEAAIIMAVLIAAAVAIAAVVITLWDTYEGKLDDSDDNYQDPNGART